MNLQCQTEATTNLKLLAEHKQHGVLIVGPHGSGKTYLARQYASYLGISDFYIINPVISDLKSTINECLESENSIVLCIEDLDSGVLQASYPLLKLIEDCPHHIYVVVTCSNLQAIPDTIPSRCALVTISPPTRSDINQYAKEQDVIAFEKLSGSTLWQCVRGLDDATTVLKFSPEQLGYFNNLPRMLPFKDSVSNITWKLQHFEDNSETPLNIVVRYLMLLLNSDHGTRACIGCLNDLAANQLSKNAILSKLVFELKYVQ